MGRAEWLSACADMRTYSIRSYLVWRGSPSMKRHHRREALKYAARLRELQK